jgi:hypothetical protein
MAVAWGSIDPSQVASVGDFTVSGFVAGTTRTATAHVWVRGSDPVQINTIDPVSVSTPVGVAPVLPSGVTVGYNDGSRQSGIAVTWDAIDPSRYASDGTFPVTGHVAGTDKTATATVKVGTGEAAFDVEVSARAQCVGANAYVAVTARNADNQSLTIQLTTAYGSRTSTVAPGNMAYQSFNTRGASVAAGTAKVKVTGGEVTTEIPVPYGTVSCS